MIEIKVLNTYCESFDRSKIGNYNIYSFYLKNIFFTQVVDKNMSVISMYNHVTKNKNIAKNYHQRVKNILVVRTEKIEKWKNLPIF